MSISFVPVFNLRNITWEIIISFNLFAAFLLNKKKEIVQSNAYRLSKFLTGKLIGGYFVANFVEMQPNNDLETID